MNCPECGMQMSCYYEGTDREVWGCDGLSGCSGPSFTAQQIEEMRTTMHYPQPREGIVGTENPYGDLLSLEDSALERRRIFCNLALQLWKSALHTNIAHRDGEKLWRRMDKPQVGDLVLEYGAYPIRRNPHEAMGILLARRQEWCHTDQEWAARDPQDWDPQDQRPHDEYWYVQYGPAPDDIVRWGNCMFGAIPIGLRGFEGENG